MSYNLLKGKRGIIFGALNSYSIAWNVAELCYLEGAEVLLTNSFSSVKKGEIYNLAKKIKSKVVVADVTSRKDLINLFNLSYEYFSNNKIDFILHSVAISYNMIKKNEYYNLDYALLMKGFDVSALSFHKIMQIAWDFNIMNEYGSIVALTYIGSDKVMPFYNDMSDYKCYLESITRNFGYHWGLKSKVRVNTVSQSPVFSNSTKNIDIFNNILSLTNKKSPLGNATASECASYIVSLFSDLTRKVTMQNLYHDGGYSMMGF
jgi:enoyl-[acyl-carrier protein] reductase I